MKKYLFVIAVISCLSFLLVSCGGGSSATTKLDVKMTEFKYEPVEFVIPAGKEITLNIANNGAALHEFVIMKHGLTVGEKFGPEDEENIYWEVEADSGQSKTVTFTAPMETGEYQIICGTEGHVEQGMIAKMIVLSK